MLTHDRSFKGLFIRRENNFYSWLRMMEHQSPHYIGHQRLHSGHHDTLTATQFVCAKSVAVEGKSPVDGTCGKDHRAGRSDIVGCVADIGLLGVVYCVRRSNYLQSLWC